MLNTTVIQEAIDELKGQQRNIAASIQTLEQLLAGTTTKNGGGGKRKPRVTLSDEPATGPVVKGSRGFPREEICATCEEKWVRKGPRSKCPTCN